MVASQNLDSKQQVWSVVGDAKNNVVVTVAKDPLGKHGTIVRLPTLHIYTRNLPYLEHNAWGEKYGKLLSQVSSNLGPARDNDSDSKLCVEAPSHGIGDMSIQSNETERVCVHWGSRASPSASWDQCAHMLLKKWCARATSGCYSW